MNNRLESIVDLKKYPIQDLNSPLIKELIKKCKNDLDQLVALLFLILFYPNL